MKEGSQLTRQSALAHSGDVPRGILNEGTAEVPKVAAGENIHMAMYLSEFCFLCLFPFSSLFLC